MARLSMLAVIVVALAAAAFADDFLDQEMSGFITTYKVPAGGVWQSFTPSYTANLTSIGVLIGATFPAAPCVPFTGTVKIYQGVGKKGVNGPFFVAQQPLTEQAVSSSDCRCSTENCVTWQKFTLDLPVTVVGGQVYSYHIVPDTTTTSFRVGLMVVDTYPRGENNFAAPGYDYPFKTYMHAQQSETLTITGDKGSNGETSTVSKTSSGTTAAIVIAVICAVAVFIAAVVIVMRRRRSNGEWLSAEDAINVWKSRFAGKDMEAPVKKHDRSRVYVIKDDKTIAPEDKPEEAIHDNWVKEEWKRYSVRAEVGDSMRWRDKTRVALPDNLHFESTVDMPEYNADESDDLDNIELPEQYNDHGHETVMMY